MSHYAYLVPLWPLLGFVIIALFTNRYHQFSARLATAMVGLSWLMSLVILWEALHAEEALEMAFTWVALPSTLTKVGWTLQMGVLVDPLSALMISFVTTVSLMVHIYSLGYMHGEKYFSRFFEFLNLFTFSMLGLVLVNNYFGLFIFWELVGLTSYLLIGFYYEKWTASQAGKKAFITTRAGDLGMLIGLLIMWTTTGTLQFSGVFGAVGQGVLSGTTLTVMAIFLFGGAVGKSAQFPLHVWLPDAMEGPTPVSALIHAATMVVAGVYLVARSMPVYMASETASMVVATIGIITALMAASIGLVQNDIKRVLAFSTVSQLGYMIMALGLGSLFAGTFHMFTHAFFKALLFLGSGSVIHAVHTNDIQEMGGLGKKMKITLWTWVIASLSIAGIPPLSGFWSKDEIVATASRHPVFLVATLLVAFMTAFYMFRLTFLTFYGTPRDQHKYDHAHESPLVMTVPLMFLAVLSVVAGFWGIPWLSHGFGHFITSGHGEHHPPSILLMAVATLVALCGIGLAYQMYYRRVWSPEAVAKRFSGAYRLLYNKYYFDELYSVLFVRPYYVLCDVLWTFDMLVIDGLVNLAGWIGLAFSVLHNWFDVYIVDGIVNGLGYTMRGLGRSLRYVQSGRLQNYTFLVAFGVLLLVIVQIDLLGLLTRLFEGTP
jgi:NADH-quinone oxidoreductase subunit L